MNSKLNYDFFNALMTESTPEKFEEQTRKFQEVMMWYGCAIREVKTKLEVLNDEFQVTRNRNPIDSIKSRIKKPISIFEKMERRGYPLTLDSIIAIHSLDNSIEYLLKIFMKWRICLPTKMI